MQWCAAILTREKGTKSEKKNDEEGEETEEEKQKKEALLMAFHHGLSRRKVKGKNEGSDEKTRQMENRAPCIYPSTIVAASTKRMNQGNDTEING